MTCFCAGLIFAFSIFHTYIYIYINTSDYHRTGVGLCAVCTASSSFQPEQLAVEQLAVEQLAVELSQGKQNRGGK